MSQNFIPHFPGKISPRGSIVDARSRVFQSLCYLRFKQKPFENYSSFISSFPYPTPNTLFSPTCERFDPKFSLFRARFWLFLPSLLCSSPSVNKVPFRTAVKRTVMLHLLMFIIMVNCHSDLYSICRKIFTDQSFVSRRHLYHRRSLLSLELSVVSYLLGKTKVEKTRICGNYVPLFLGRDVMNACE